MQSFKAAATTANPDMFCHSSFFLRGDDCNSCHQTRLPDLGELDHPAVAFHHDDAVDLSSSSFFSLKPSNVANNLHYGALNTSIGATEIISSGIRCLDTGQFMYQKGPTFGASLGNEHIENWADPGLADICQQTVTSTDVDTDHKNQVHGVQDGPIMVDSVDQSKSKFGDQKMLRRLAQNREAARKSRLRKKAYVQQLENNRHRLTELEQELQMARQQGSFITTRRSGDHGHSAMGNTALAFDMEYGCWLNEHQRLINDLRSAVNSNIGDSELCILVGGVMAHYDEVFRLKSIGTKADVFHMLSGMWKTPAERCFMWLGGFRSSELLKILGNHLEPLTDQQLMGICNLQQSCQQAEDALSQGMEALQQSLVDTLSSTCLGPAAPGNVADYMGQMAIAMGKIVTLENFLHQADLLRQQTLQQMHRILTTRQAALALLVISDYTSRLRALSSLWLARPRN
ncbi:Transcription factor PERIANTHIA [Hibiscus syriacus]|uniref:Transcription factor PERIANTHIA n=1 Tax=Hibiscus syriacus TaxID=106335 RepID=A0A6A3C5X3_HIBSY|nr:transcription factor TGA2.3-like [Hibiscus syriacus]KAE8724635.1 Transcription factor PERIANTHIA [Hibiscus syriacus]